MFRKRGVRKARTWQEYPFGTQGIFLQGIFSFLGADKIKQIRNGYLHIYTTEKTGGLRTILVLRQMHANSYIALC